MIQNPTAQQFVKQLRATAKRGKQTHAKLAAYLGVNRATMRNWLYRDQRPNDWAVAALSKRLAKLKNNHR